MDRINEALFEAALTAARAIGSDLLAMSCFVSNWRSQSESVEELEAA